MPISQTTKNWLTTIGGSFAVAAVPYFLGPEPGANDGWSIWKVALLTAAFAGMQGAWHAYQDKSGKPSAASVASA